MLEVGKQWTCAIQIQYAAPYDLGQTHQQGVTWHVSERSATPPFLEDPCALTLNERAGKRFRYEHLPVEVSGGVSQATAAGSMPGERGEGTLNEHKSARTCWKLGVLWRSQVDRVAEQRVDNQATKRALQVTACSRSTHLRIVPVWVRRTAV